MKPGTKGIISKLLFTLDSNQRLGTLTIDESSAEQKECFGKKDFVQNIQTT